MLGPYIYSKAESTERQIFVHELANLISQMFS